MQRSDSPAPRPNAALRKPAASRAIAAVMAAAACALLATGALGGCGSTQRAPTAANRTASTGDSRELLEATNAYNAREFGRAVTLARGAASGASGLPRARARYLEGLASIQLGNHDDAARALREATEAADRTLAANARVSLGTAEVGRRDFRAAAEAYRRAALILDGDERRRAEELEALCLSRVPGSAQPRPLQPPPAQQPDAVAIGQRSGAPAEERTATERLVNGMEVEPVAFSIQAGAFSERQRAERLAESLGAESRRAGTGAPRVIEKPRPGQSPVFVVQLGRFPNRTVAGKAMLQFGQRGFTVERALE